MRQKSGMMKKLLQNKKLLEIKKKMLAGIFLKIKKGSRKSPQE